MDAVRSSSFKYTKHLPLTVDTSRYESSHGHKPTGEGWWAFEYTLSNGRVVQSEFHGTYTHAKNQASKVAKSFFASTLVVLPS